MLINQIEQRISIRTQENELKKKMNLKLLNLIEKSKSGLDLVWPFNPHPFFSCF